MRSVTQLVTFADITQNRLCTLPIHYIVIRYPQQMVQMGLCDLSHTYQVTNVFPACFCHPTLGNFDVSPNVNETFILYFIFQLDWPPPKSPCPHQGALFLFSRHSLTIDLLVNSINPLGETKVIQTANKSLLNRRE